MIYYNNNFSLKRDITKLKCWTLILLVIIVILTPIRTAVVDKHPKLIIDQDGGADDAMAVFMALLYEKYFNGPTVIALTTAHGNVDEDQSFINIQRILDVAERRDVPIYRGSNNSLVLSLPSDGYFGTDGLGDNDFGPVQRIPAQPEHAALGIIHLANKYPGEITIVALGALTNIALAISLDPALISKLSHLYVGAGNVYSESVTTAEFNAAQDAEAYEIVVKNASPEKVTILPFSQVIPTNVTRDWRVNVLGAIPSKIMKAQNSFERISLPTSTTWGLLDPNVMGVVLDDAVIREPKCSQNGIILCGEQRGINTNNFTTVEEANVKLVNGIIEEEYQNLLLSVFSAELKI